MDRIKNNFLLEKSFFKTVFAIVLPIAAQNVISFGVNVMDSVMLGSLGDVAISAANLGGQPFFLLMGFGFGLSSGGSVLIAQYWGKKDMARIRKVMSLSMKFVFVMAVLFTLVCTLMPSAVMRLFTPDLEIVTAAASYLQLAALAYLPYSISNNYIMSLRAVEQVKISAAIYGVSFFVNVFFNYGFIFGKFGFPALGVRGAAVGTVLARCTELLLALLYMYFGEKRVHFRLRHVMEFDKELLPDYIRHSLPVVGNELLWSFGVTVISAILGHLGSVYVTANSIASVANQLALVFVAGVANAAAVLTGKTIGEGNRERTRKVANTLLFMAVCIGCISCVLLLLGRTPFLSLYKVSQQAYDAAWHILTVVALVQLCAGYEITCVVGVLRGGGDTRTSFIIDCGCQWLIGIPLALFAGFVMGWPAHLVYLCMRMESPAKAICCALRIHSGKWVRKVTLD